MVIVLQTPCLDEVLRELGVGEERDGVRDQHHIALAELLQLQVHLVDLNQASRLCSLVTRYLDYLCIKWIMVEQVCAMVVPPIFFIIVVPAAIKAMFVVDITDLISDSDSASGVW